MSKISMRSEQMSSMRQISYAKLYKVLGVISLVCGGLSPPAAALSELPGFFRFSLLRTIALSLEMAIRLESPLMTLALPLSIIAIICGFLYYRGIRKEKFENFKTSVLVSIVLGFISMFLVFTTVVDKAACIIWRGLRPANYEIVVKLGSAADQKVTIEKLTDAVSVLSKRLRDFGQFHKPEGVNPDRIIIKLSTKHRGSIDAFRQVVSTGYLTFNLVHEANWSLVRQMSDPDFQLPIGYEKLQLKGEWFFVKTAPELKGESISAATVEFDKDFHIPYVRVTFDREGTEILARITDENVNRTLAIVLDGGLVSTPVIREPISGGQVRISGNFEADEAYETAKALRYGGLPFPIYVVSEGSLKWYMRKRCVKS